MKARCCRARAEKNMKSSAHSCVGPKMALLHRHSLQGRQPSLLQPKGLTKEQRPQLLRQSLARHGFAEDRINLVVRDAAPENVQTYPPTNGMMGNAVR
mmetsp:Transcript_16782/g.47896  ORF Transcript_16782/g.47896 Transcript_16782/m.47896 type:complete len:98 (+) Transcript_16782:1235-1528(+)